MYEKIFDFLVSEGYNVYPPGTNIDFKDPIIILKENEPISVRGLGYMNRMYYLYCHTPFTSYTQALDFKDKVDKSMQRLRNFDRVFSGAQILVDESTNTYLTILQYNNKVKRRA